MFLLPSVLARKRMWNPKYPVCIRLAGGSNSREDEGGGSEPSSSSERDPDPPATLYLFGRTGREKEEWFRHFLFASMDGEGEAGRSGTRWMCVGVCVAYGLHAPVLCLPAASRDGFRKRKV